MANNEKSTKKKDQNTPVISESNLEQEIITAVVQEEKPIKKLVSNDDILELFFKEYFTKLCSQRKINIKPDDVKAYLKKAEQYIRLFNAGSEFTNFILGVTSDQIPIPNEFKDLIQPDSVRFVPSDRRTKNLRKYYSFDDKNLSLIEWYEVIDNLRRVRKMSSVDDVTNLAALRTAKSYNDVMDRIVFVKDETVKMDSNPFIPLILDDASTALFNKDYFNISVREIVKFYVAKMV